MIKALIIEDSISLVGARITTLCITFPRFILPEFNTHRMISKNASSSRAIPTSKLIQQAEDSPFVPKVFTKNKPGMQATEIIERQDEARGVWLTARDAAITHAKQLQALGVHKQSISRLLEPFLYSTVVCTSTEWNNFFALRIHSDAQPEIKELAEAMYEAINSSTPKDLQLGEWHLPFVSESERSLIALEDQLKVSTARCARVSYNNHDGTSSTLEQDLALYDRLVGGEPKHASPTEHQAQAQLKEFKSGNFTGWLQYRKTLPNENITEFYKKQKDT